MSLRELLRRSKHAASASAYTYRGSIMIHVVAIITAVSGKRDALVRAFKGVVPTVEAEAGCIEYAPVVDVEGANPAYGPDTFLVIEKWESMAALKAHAAAPHMAAYSSETKHLLASAAVHVLTAA
jgi:quinol monooxygenase YgiN